MFSNIFRFEIRQHFKKSFTWIFLALMVAQGVYYMQHSAEFYSADKTFSNAPAIVYTVLAGMGYLGFVVAAIFGGMVLGKDIDHKTASLLYTTRAKEKQFFLARYLGSFVVLSLLYGGYLVGILLFSYLPFPNLGPVSWLTVLRGTILIFIPNVFIIYTLCFSVSTLFRNTRLAYAVALTCMLLMIFGETTFESNPYMTLFDPTAFSVLHNMLDHLSPAQKNAFRPPFSGDLLYNRIIWLSGSIILFALALKNFSFKSFAVRTEKASRKIESQTASPLHIPVLEKLVPVRQYFSIGSDLSKVLSLSWLEYKSVTRPVGFKIFLFLLLVIYVGYVSVWQQEFYSAAPTLPVTVEITSVTLPLAFYVQLFLIINTTELLFRASSSSFWQISDALPVPSWVSILSKITAMVLVAMTILLSFVIFGVLVQTAKGYYHFEWQIYFNDLFIRWLPKYLLYILLTVFVAGLTANRYATHWITILFLIFSVILHETDVIEQNRLNFSFSPGTKMDTDMNGNGIFTLAHFWYMTYWTALSAALVMLSLWLWQRGTPVSFSKRLVKIKKQIEPVSFTIFCLGLTVFICCGSFIFRTVNKENNFQTKEQQRAESAVYERSYSPYRYRPQPSIEDLVVDLDLYPSQREAEYHAKLVMENKSAENIDTLHVEWMDFSQIRTIRANDRVLHPVSQDTTLRHNMYRLMKALAPGEKILIEIFGQLKYNGFTNADPQKDLTFNGSILAAGIIPYFGYDSRRELLENQYRPAYDLPKLQNRLPDTTDTFARQQLFASTQAGRLHFTLNISTEGTQKLVAPGQLAKEWNQNGRHYKRFTSEQPATFDFAVLSADYSVQKSSVMSGGKKVDIELYYHPAHAYNTSHILTAAQKALTVLGQKLGPYPYQTLRIAERPRYDEELLTFDNMMVLPENHGWIADVRKNEDLDYLNFATTLLIARQFMQQANISRTQGYPVVTRSIPYYLALCQLEKQNGQKAVENHLQKAHDHYLKGRAQETNREPSLIKTDEDATYVFNEKGGSLLFRLGKQIGTENLDRIIAGYLQESKAESKPSTVFAFYKQLLDSTPEKYLSQVRKEFETIEE